MIPLADTHVHLLAGLDDGPPSRDVALAMCRKLVSEGVQHATALAHQNEGYPENTAERLRTAATQLMSDLTANDIPLSVYPTGEVMLSHTTFDDFQSGKLLTVGNHGKWLLVEMPHGVCLNILPIAEAFREVGVRLIIAHAERYSEILNDPELTARWIAAGCLIQVTARSIAEPWNSTVEKSLKRWATGGFIHMLGSDGHGIDRRRPELAAGFERLKIWIGRTAAERIGSEWGLAVLQGKPVDNPPPKPPTRSWLLKLLGG
jgi:protein-tyrosine phosphatase